jgi:hypothetical protein
MNSNSLFKPIELQKDSRIARIRYSRDGGYELHKLDPGRFNGCRVMQYPTRKKAIVAARDFIKNSGRWTKGRLEHLKDPE